MTASTDRGLKVERAAEVIVDLAGGGAGRRGSGYLVSPGRVLTAAHVVEGAEAVQVRFEADRPGERTVEAAVGWRHEYLDVAVLTLAEDDGIDLPPVRFGRTGEQDAVLRCAALGFPRFKLRTRRARSLYRDAEHIHASCAVLSNRREGTLDLVVSSPPADDPDPERDAWEGMSGAAVFSSGCLVGVVTRHHKSDGPGRIAATRVDRWAEAVSVTELAELEHLLGHGLRPAALSDAVPPTTLELIQEAYRAQLADDFAPAQLEERESELRDLVAFCSGSEQYLRLQGLPWAGKSALAAWFALHPPRGVVPVWFFITRRNAHQSDSEAFTAALIDQLAAIAGPEWAVHHSLSARDVVRGLLLRKAAERVAQQGGTLLLVVDGLDEDQFLMPGGSGPSIASLLPAELPPNVRVLTTSRPSPDLPSDVVDGHPLLDCRVLELTAAEAARRIERRARHELQEALCGDELQIDLIGLLTAARGTLTVHDLGELTGDKHHKLTRRLGSAFGRILQERGTGGDSGEDVTLYVADRGYLFAHDTLLTAAQEALGRDVDVYRERLHAWAETYRRKGWPEHTPLYLLQPYGRLVGFLHDAGRAVELATDVRRRDRLREVTGSDAACLAEIAAARQVVRRTAPDDLGGLACLAAVRDLVARRNESLHPDIPAVHARLGRVRQAIGLAHSVFRPVDRVRALEGVARVLADAGDQRAVGLAEEALRLAESTLADDGWYYPYSNVQAAKGTLVTVLAVLGRKDEALRCLMELPLTRYDFDHSVAVRTLVETAGALKDPVHMAELLARAEKAAENISSLPDRLRSLAAIAAAWSAGSEPGRAARLYDSIVALARRHADDFANVPAVAAEVLHRVRPQEAERLTRLAGALADRLLPCLEASPDGFRGVGAVQGLVAIDRMDDAERLAAVVWADEYVQVPAMWLAVAEGWARRGQSAEAWAALEKSGGSASYGPIEDGRSTARVTGLLVESGDGEQLETLLLTAADTWPWGVAEALAVLAAHCADDDPERSLRLLHHAERGQPLMDDSFFDPHHERVVALAHALVTVNRSDDAERLVEAMRAPKARARGYAVVSAALAREDGHRALHLAERAIDAVPTAEGWTSSAKTLTVAVQALARTGAAKRAVQVADELAGELWDPTGEDHCRHAALVEAAEGLWPRAPDEAGCMIDALLLEMRAISVPSLARLLTVVLPHDAVRAAHVKNMLHGRDSQESAQYGHDNRALLSLLAATVGPAGARRRLDDLVSTTEKARKFREGSATAITCAALGDHETALAVAQGAADDGERSATLADLAAYAACVPGAPMGLWFGADLWPARSIALSLAGLLLPPPSGPDLPRARELLADALSPDGWHYAVPVLAEIDPAVVLRVRDVVFGHLGLSG